MKRATIGPILALMALIVLSPGPEVLAAYHDLITAVALKYENNDNLFLSSANELSDTIVTATPKLALVRHTELYTLGVDGRLDFYRYRENDVFDDVDQWYKAFLNATPTERWRVSADAQFSDDNRPDRDLLETGLVLRNINRQRVSAGASAYYTFSEMLAGGLALGFTNEAFDDPLTSDRQDFFAIFSATRSLDEWLVRTKGRLNLGYRRYEFDRSIQRRFTQDIFEVTTDSSDRTEVDAYSLTAGTETALTEKVDLMLDLGGRYARTQREVRFGRFYEPPLIVEAPVVIAESVDSFGFVGNLSLIYRGERSRCNFGFSHDLVPVSGDNTTVNRTSVRLRGSVRLLENLRGDLFGQWFRNRSEQDDLTRDDINRQTWNLGGALRWAMTDYLDLAANYTYTLLDDRQAGTTAYRNRVVLSIEAHHDWLD